MKIEIIPINSKYEHLLGLYDPIPANKFFPEWYKKMKLGNYMDSAFNEGEVNTAKRCPAIQDLVNEGFILPMWGNFHFKTDYKKDGSILRQKWDFSTAQALDESIDFWVGHHSINQTYGMDLNRDMENRVMKLKYPFSFKVPEGYSLLYTDPFYHFRKDIRCLMGLVEADKWGQITFPFELLSDKFTIKSGEPMIHIIPVKRNIDKFELVTRKGTNEEYYNINDQFIKYFSTNKNYKK